MGFAGWSKRAAIWRSAGATLALLTPFLMVPPTVGLAPAAFAQDGWTPSFRTQPSARPRTPPPAQPEGPPPEWREPPAASSDRPGAAVPGRIEKMDLEPIAANDGSGLPLELWNGLDIKAFEGLLTTLEIPPRSPTLNGLWKRMLQSSAPPPSGAPPDHFAAVRLEALYRSGMLAEMAEAETTGAASPIVTTILARRDIGLGDPARGCQRVKSLSDPRAGLPERLRGELQLLLGYCSAVSNDKPGAGIAASLAREEGLEADLALSVLSGIADDLKPSLVLPKRVLLLDYRFLELLGPVNGRQVMERAEPALLAVLAGDRNADASARAAAAEAALRINAIAPEIVAQTYRDVAAERRQGPGDGDPALRRANEFVSADQAPAGGQTAQSLYGLMRDARRGGFAMQMGQVVATRYERTRPGPQDSLLAEPITEALLSAGKIPEARTWAAIGPQGLPHWMALIDIVDPARKSWRFGTLAVLEDLAMRGRLSPDVLHRLAAVLDALDIDVPVPLWDAANRAGQPRGGYLPETGVLAELAEAAKRRESARTILVAMRALGPGGPEAANILPLGDSIRALRKIGLETEARRLALEALLPVWPRLAP